MRMSGIRHDRCWPQADHGPAWGNNHSGQVADGTTTNRHLPVEGLSAVTMISAGALHSLAR